MSSQRGRGEAAILKTTQLRKELQTMCKSYKEMTGNAARTESKAQADSSPTDNVPAWGQLGRRRASHLPRL